jgi:protein-S-isoprenylcysteine O-methyltransferase Ste14
MKSAVTVIITASKAIAKEFANTSAYQIHYIIVVILNLVSRFSLKVSLPKSQEDSDPLKYRRVLVSTLLYAFVRDFTTFAECPWGVLSL